MAQLTCQIENMINRVFFILALLATHAALAQPVSRAYEEAAYAQAITEYLKAAAKRHGTTLDTLIVGKRPGFPVVTLPPKVGNTTILFLTQKENDKKRNYNPTLVFTNMVGEVAKDNATFIFVTFYPGYTHQYDCMIDLKYNPQQKVFTLDHQEFKNYAYK